ncbi:hypothetical protein OIU77_003599 [Salix suchowensis]|uniref:Uncharacterized protein n=1 Tax=Salix suchowensis TaxID=1278906 RepID=A0ABQ9B214_9ROSI|nr:hypothetical protein OIU77_003599 [Salix suchowensis]
MFVITQAFAGHLGDLEFAGISIANNVIVGFDFGLLLGMASALETLCGQAFGAKKYYMLGVYMQRSWIVLFICCVLLLPLYLFASPVLKLFGQPDDIAELSGKAAVWMIPLHFSFAFQFPLQRFLQSQLKNMVIAWVSLVALVVHIFVSWLLVYQLQLGVQGTAMTLNFSWWVLVFGLLGYTICGGCPLTWNGFLHRSLFWPLGIHHTLCCFRGHALLGELVLQNTHLNDWESQERRNCTGCFVHMHDHKWLGADDSSSFLCRNRS